MFNKIRNFVTIAAALSAFVFVILGDSQKVIQNNADIFVGMIALGLIVIAMVLWLPEIKK